MEDDRERLTELMSIWNKVLRDAQQLDGVLWTAQDLAKAGNVDDSYIRRLLLEGKLEGVKFGGRWVIFDKEARSWLARRAKQLEMPLPVDEG